MNEITKRTRYRWLVLLVLVIFLTGLPGIFALPAEWILFNPDSYKQALAEENAYSQFPLLLGQMIAEGGNLFLFGSGDHLLQVLQHSNYEAIVQQIFPEDWVRAQADGLIDQFWAYFNFQSPRLRLAVDFRPIKERLTGEQSAQIAAAIVQGFPPCQGSDLLNWALQALNGTVDQLPLCRPPAQFVGAANLLAEELLKGSAALMPDELDLAGLLRLPAAVGLPAAIHPPGAQPVATAWAGGFRVYHFFRRADRWLPWAALLLLVPVGLLARGAPRPAALKDGKPSPLRPAAPAELRSVDGLPSPLRDPFYWLGLSLLLPGFAALIIALLLGLLSDQIAPFVIGRLFGANLIAFNLLVGMLVRVTTRCMLASAEIALGVTLTGTILLGIALWLRKGTWKDLSTGS